MKAMARKSSKTERNVAEAIELYLESLAAHGEPAPEEGRSFQGRGLSVLDRARPQTGRIVRWRTEVRTVVPNACWTYDQASAAAFDHSRRGPLDRRVHQIALIGVAERQCDLSRTRGFRHCVPGTRESPSPVSSCNYFRGSKRSSISVSTFTGWPA